MASSSEDLIPNTGAHVPEDKDQFLVQTPYGQGTVIGTRKNEKNEVEMREIELTGWQKTETASAGPHDRPTILYSPSDFLSIQPTKGCGVLCFAGRGRVVNVLEDKVVVELSSWRLADRSLVTCYLAKSAVQVVRPKQIYEMSVYEKIDRALELKDQAAGYFRGKEYDLALQTYARAVDAVKYVQHKADSPNTLRADLIVVMVTCSNNAGTCCSHLGYHDLAIKYATQSLSLIEALEEKKGMKIHTVLRKDGHADSKLFGEWKVKSWMILASAQYEKDEAKVSMDVITKARETVVLFVSDNDTSPQSSRHLSLLDKNLVKLYAKCRDRRKSQRDKERQRARAMFASESAKENGHSLQAAPETSKEQDTWTASDNESEKPVPSTKKSTGNPDNKRSNDDKELAWHQDPAVLGGIGVIVGVLGTLVLLTRLARRK